MIVIRTPSGDRCLGSRVDKSTGGTSLTGFPVAKVVIRLDLPVPCRRRQQYELQKGLLPWIKQAQAEI